MFLSAVHLFTPTLVTPTLVTPMLNEGDTTVRGAVWGEYGVEKYKAEARLLNSGLNVMSLRPPYIYGADNPEPRERFNWNRLLHNKEILIPGTGNTSLQFLLLSDDLANAVETVVSSNSFSTGAFNIASDRPITFRTYVELLAEIAGVTVKIKTVDTDLLDCKAREFFPFRNYNCALATEKLRACMFVEYTENRVGFEHTFQAVSRDVILNDVYSDVKERTLYELLEKAGKFITTQH